MATAIGARLRVLTSGANNVSERGTAFAIATLEAAEPMVPQQKHTTLGRGWSKHAQTEAGLSRALVVSRGAWWRHERDKRNSQLRREVRRANREVQRVRTAAKDRFLERYVEELEKKVHKNNHWGFFQRLKSLRIEETREVHSQ